MIHRVLVAARGVAARRLIRAAQAEGREVVLAYADADADLPILEEVDFPAYAGPDPDDLDRLVGVAQDAGCDLIAPEPGRDWDWRQLAQLAQQANLRIVAPSAEALRPLSSEALELARTHGLKYSPGAGPHEGLLIADRVQGVLLPGGRWIGRSFLLGPAQVGPPGAARLQRWVREIGLVGAATVRWSEGGDFDLKPGLPSNFEAYERAFGVDVWAAGERTWLGQPLHWVGAETGLSRWSLEVRLRWSGVGRLEACRWAEGLDSVWVSGLEVSAGSPQEAARGWFEGPTLRSTLVRAVQALRASEVEGCSCDRDAVVEELLGAWGSGGSLEDC